MARDGSGTYSLPATMAVASQQASSVTVNSIMDDIAQALTDSINKDGTKAFAANQSMGGFKITSHAEGSATTDVANVHQVQQNKLARATTVGGTGDAITLSLTPTATSYNTGMQVFYFSASANTVSNPTVNVDGLGAKTIKKNPNGDALGIGELAVGSLIEMRYSGADFLITSTSGTASSSDIATGTNDFKQITPAGLVTKEATAAQYRANTADKLLTTDIVWSAAEEVTLTDAVTIAVDMSTFINAKVTLAGNRTLGQPSNTKVGQSGVIRIIQDATGSRTLAYHADWKFVGGIDPVLSTAANSIDLLHYQVIATNLIFASLSKAVS